MSLEAYLTIDGAVARIRLMGVLDEEAVPLLRSLLQQAVAHPVDRLVLRMDALEDICVAGIRCLVATQQTMAEGTEMIFLDVQPGPEHKLRLAGLHRALGVLWAAVPA
ncbi:STAS domain-containing protein [Streptosporangium algeriense]|uniref:STAS domain-containing protein n=1 Tax=Streptosporangium algeriense TaxID=1682748 RepID=A0ABW3E865_9ACTN